MRVLNSLQLLPLSLIVAKEVSVLTGVDVLMNLQQEPLAEFKRLRRGFSLNAGNGHIGQQRKQAGTDTVTER